MQRTLINLILNDFYDTDVSQMYLNENDPNIAKALEIFRAGKAFPQAPAKRAHKVVKRPVKAIKARR